jgi:flagellin-like hook-associated protein FlgL
MSDITLTAGIRQNLLSLQKTSADLTTTQEALATGKSVNSAADNPSAYFTSQNLTNSANSLSALLDSIGQGQQTIDAATNGLTGITSLLQQALSTVQQAQQAAQTSGGTTGSLAVTTATVGTAGAGTLNILVGSTTYGITVTASETASQIESAINSTSGLGSSGALTASDSGGKIVLTANSGSTSFSVAANAVSATLGLTTDSSTNTAVYGSSSTRTTLQSNYNGLLTQINQLAADSGYNGINLLNGNNLLIDFNQPGTSAITISGVTDNSSGLGLSSISGAVSGSFQDNSALSSAVTAINSAISTVQTQTETFGTNSGVIGTRQTFTTNMINTLQTGASNLVAADQNQQSANLLTEQTQQQLEISALSIANQANQSVLKLFG